MYVAPDSLAPAPAPRPRPRSPSPRPLVTPSPRPPSRKRSAGNNYPSHQSYSSQQGKYYSSRSYSSQNYSSQNYSKQNGESPRGERAGISRHSPSPTFEKEARIQYDIETQEKYEEIQAGAIDEKEDNENEIIKGGRRGTVQFSTYKPRGASAPRVRGGERTSNLRRTGSGDYNSNHTVGVQTCSSFRDIWHPDSSRLSPENSSTSNNINNG